MSEITAMKMVQQMCEQSLSPDFFDQWEAIRAELFARRKKLSEQSPSPQIAERNGLPRRCQIDLMSRPELRIHDAMQTVEAAGAHPLLTEAINLLAQARDKVADFVELPTEKDAGNE
jgi:hypothetical protein